MCTLIFGWSAQEAKLTKCQNSTRKGLNQFYCSAMRRLMFKLPWVGTFFIATWKWPLLCHSLNMLVVKLYWKRSILRENRLHWYCSKRKEHRFPQPSLASSSSYCPPNSVSSQHSEWGLSIKSTSQSGGFSWLAILTQCCHDTAVRLIPWTGTGCGNLCPTGVRNSQLTLI